MIESWTALGLWQLINLGHPAIQLHEQFATRPNTGRTEMHRFSSFVQWQLAPRLSNLVDGMCLLFLARYFGTFFNDSRAVGGTSSLLLSALGLCLYWRGVIGLGKLPHPKLTTLIRALAGVGLLFLQIWRWHSFGPVIGLVVLSSALVIYVWGTVGYCRSKRLSVLIIVSAVLLPPVGLLLPMCMKDYAEPPVSSESPTISQLLPQLIWRAGIHAAFIMIPFVIGAMVLLNQLELPPEFSNVYSMRAIGAGGGVGILVGRLALMLIRVRALFK